MQSLTLVPRYASAIAEGSMLQCHEDDVYHNKLT